MLTTNAIINGHKIFSFIFNFFPSRYIHKADQCNRNKPILLEDDPIMWPYDEHSPFKTLLLDLPYHYSGVIMGALGSQITGVSIICSTVVFVHAQIKNTKAPRHWALWGEPPVTGGFPQRASKAENVSIWWRHHDRPTNRPLPADPCFTFRIVHTKLHTANIWIK